MAKAPHLGGSIQTASCVVRNPELLQNCHDIGQWLAINGVKPIARDQRSLTMQAGMAAHCVDNLLTTFLPVFTSVDGH